MIIQKEFYFVRHGQTNSNLLEGLHKGDHKEDVPLNETGQLQAQAIAPVIAQLPIQTICCSPMLRAQQTKELISYDLCAAHHTIDDLSECSMQIWQEMTQLGMYCAPPLKGEVRLFMDRVRKGVNCALSRPTPSLIVAHGGIHWAVCCLMGIQQHDWNISNCAVVHFFIGGSGQWLADQLTPTCRPLLADSAHLVDNL